MAKLTNELYQKYESPDGGTEVEILYNDQHDYFYFNVNHFGALVSGDTSIVNNYEDDYVSFKAISADNASFDLVDQFTIVVKNA